MVAKVPLGWTVLNAVNGSPEAVLGGRAFMCALPWVFQDYYIGKHGETNGQRALDLLVDIVTWLRGGLAAGRVAVCADDWDLTWYSDGADAPGVGALARAALEAAGFTVSTYAHDGVVAAAQSCDVLVVDGRSAADANAHLEELEDFTEADGVFLGLWQFTSFSNLYSITADYARQQGPTVDLYGYAGAEAIFARAFGGSGFTCGTWGGRIGGFSPGRTEDGVRCIFRNAINSYHYGVFGLYTLHADAGLGDDI